MRLMGIALSLTLLATGGLRADEPKETKPAGPLGKYEKIADPFTITFDFKKDGTCTFAMNNAGEGCTAHTKYKVEKEKITFEITKFETKGNFPVTKEAGYKFTCEFAMKDKTFNLKKFDAADVDDGARAIIEGEYGPPKGD